MNNNNIAGNKTKICNDEDDDNNLNITYWKAADSYHLVRKLQPRPSKKVVVMMMIPEMIQLVMIMIIDMNMERGKVIFLIF